MHQEIWKGLFHVMEAFWRRAGQALKYVKKCLERAGKSQVSWLYSDGGRGIGRAILLKASSATSCLDLCVLNFLRVPKEGVPDLFITFPRRGRWGVVELESCQHSDIRNRARLCLTAGDVYSLGT